MKAGLFGGDWEDYIQPIHDYFDNAIAAIQSGGAHAAIARMQAEDDALGDGAMVSDTTTDAGNPPPSLLLANAANSAGGSAMTSNVNAATPANPPLADRSFLGANEGFKPQVYLPDPIKNPAPANGEDPGALTGITVATGIDLGAHSAADLKRWGVSDRGIQQLTPMLGLKGDAARKYYNGLANAPPTVSDADAKAMDQGAFDDTVSQVQRSFDATNPVTKFAALRPEVRTAIVDLAYQYGTNLAARTPNFWKDVTSGDFNAAVGELRNFHDAYPARRNREADQMKKGIDAQAAAAPGT